MAAEPPEPLKMTIYVPPDLVDALDQLKIEDQTAGKVSRNMKRPPYVIWALVQYARQRGQKVKDPPDKTKKR